MEPASKRSRLLPPLEFGSSPRFNDYNSIAAIRPARGYGWNSSEGDEEDEERTIEEEQTMIAENQDENQVREFFKDHDEGPDPVLEESRRLLATKLKSKFEAIFEKYGKDFTGIGDEIDLETGRIIVDNGHLAEMEDERDEGINDQEANILTAFEAATDDKTDSEDDSEAVADEEDSADGMDDDMVLYESNDDAAAPSMPLGLNSIQTFPEKEDEQPSMSAGEQLVLPSDDQIMAQFGDVLGPQIICFVARQRDTHQPATDDSTIEPAWRVPGPPIQPTPRRRPTLKSLLLQSDISQLARFIAKKPKYSSVWAPQMPRGRPRKDGSDAVAMMKGESFMRGSTWYSSSYTTTTSTRTTLESANGHTSSHILQKDVAFADGMPSLDNRQRVSPRSEDDEEYTDDEDSEYNEPEDALQSEPEVETESFNPKPKKRAQVEMEPHSPKPKKRTKTVKVEPFRDPSAWATIPKDKTGRKAKTTYTDEDNLILLQWVAELEAQGVDSIFAHKHWKPLEAKNPRHTYLSWLDRYRKHYYDKKRSYNKGVVKPEEEYSSSTPDYDVLDDGDSLAINATTLETYTGDLAGESPHSSTRSSAEGESGRLLDPLISNSSPQQSFQQIKAASSRSSARLAAQEKISDKIPSVTNADGMENIDPRLFQDSWTSGAALSRNEPVKSPTILPSIKTQSQSHDAVQSRIIFEPPASVITQPRAILPGDKPKTAPKHNAEKPHSERPSNLANKRKEIRAPIARMTPVSQQSIVVDDSTRKESEPKIIGAKSAEKFSRNIIDPSYDFSDEEDEHRPQIDEVDRSTSTHVGSVPVEEDSIPLPLENWKPEAHVEPKLPPFSVIQAPASKLPMMLSQLQKSAPLSQSPTLQKPSAQTAVPVTQVGRPSLLATPKTSKPIITEIVDSDDMDELSIGGDEFDLFSARPSRGSSAAPKSESSMRRWVPNTRLTPARATPTVSSKHSPYSLGVSGSPRTPGSSTRS